MSKKFRYSLLAILIFVMAFGMIGSASAQEAAPGSAQGTNETGRRPLRGRLGLRGEITSINGSSLTIEVGNHTVQIVTANQTHFHIIGQETAVLADFQVGDTILARGRRQEDDSMVATLILLQPDGDLVWGRIATIEDDKVILNGRDQQEITVNVSADTIVAMRGQELTWGGDPSGQEVLREGSLLAAFGEISDDGLNLDAHTLISPQPRPRPYSRAGTITTVGDDQFTMTTLRGDEVTVQVNEETHFRMPGVEEPGLDDFAVGDEVVVLGQPGEDETFTARIVAAVPENRPHGRPIAGEIIAITGDEISLETLRGATITVITTPDTIFRIGRDNEATLTDFAAGDMVAVFGQRGEDDGVVTATHVMKRK